MLEVRCPVPVEQRSSSNEMWRLESRWVEAQVFLWRGGKGESSGEGWELGEAIRGAYEDGDGEMEVVECWDGVESESEAGEEGTPSVGGEWEVGDLRLDGRSEWAGDVVWCASGREVDVRRVEW